MSTSIQSEVYEAELVESDQFNPFAAPVAIDHSVAISDGIGRASQAEINEVNRSLVGAEISYVAIWIVFIASVFNGSDIAFWIWAATSMIAWFCFVRMILSCNDFDLATFLAIIAFPVPGFGSAIFFAFKQHSTRFLVWNGYGPRFLGSAPDPDEIGAMNADPNYRPSHYFRHDGSRRKPVWSLSGSFIAIVTMLFVSSIVFA